MKVIGLLLQSLQHISIKPDHDAGDGRGGASCTLVTGMEAAVQSKDEHFRGVCLVQ